MAESKSKKDKSKSKKDKSRSKKVGPSHKKDKKRRRTKETEQPPVIVPPDIADESCRPEEKESVQLQATEPTDHTLPIMTEEVRPAVQQQTSRGRICMAAVVRGVKSLLSSSLGLMAVVSVYTVASGLWFRSLELPREEERNQRMAEAHDQINRSVHYLADVLADRHYSQVQSYDNCSLYVMDNQFAPKGTYASSACLSSASPQVRQSPFCKCVRTYRRRYQKQVCKKYN